MNLGSPLAMSGASRALKRLSREHLAGTTPKPRRSDWELRPVELKIDYGRWLAGTRGTVVDAFSDEAVVEIADEEGVTLDLFSLPYRALTPIPQPEQEQLAL
jgi:hypothetical protein